KLPDVGREARGSSMRQNTSGVWRMFTWYLPFWKYCSSLTGQVLALLASESSNHTWVNATGPTGCAGAGGGAAGLPAGAAAGALGALGAGGGGAGTGCDGGAGTAAGTATGGAA